jgi:hypothetical protein
VPASRPKQGYGAIMLWHKMRHFIVAAKAIDRRLMDVTANDDARVSGIQTIACARAIAHIAPFSGRRRICVNIKAVPLCDCHGQSVKEGALVVRQLAPRPFGRTGRIAGHIAVKVAIHVVMIAFNRQRTLGAHVLNNRQHSIGIPAIANKVAQHHKSAHPVVRRILQTRLQRLQIRMNVAEQCDQWTFPCYPFVSLGGVAGQGKVMGHGVRLCFWMGVRKAAWKVARLLYGWVLGSIVGAGRGACFFKAAI